VLGLSDRSKGIGGREESEGADVATKRGGVSGRRGEKGSFTAVRRSRVREEKRVWLDFLTGQTMRRVTKYSRD